MLFYSFTGKHRLFYIPETIPSPYNPNTHTITHLPLTVLLAKPSPFIPSSLRHCAPTFRALRVLRSIETCREHRNTQRSRLDMSSSETSESSTNPSMLHGHAAYVAAAAKVCESVIVMTTAWNLSPGIDSSNPSLAPSYLILFQNLVF